LKVIEDTKKALDDLKVAQTGGFYDPAQRGKRQNTLPAELEVIKETLEASKSPLQQYAESVDNVQASLQNVALSGLKSMEDALVSLVNGTMSAKDAFRSMASSIINDLIRIMIQKSITGPIAGAMDGFFSGGGKAIGGSVQSGKPYMVGERGAEMFVPNQSGSIIPSNRLANGGGGTTIVQNINVTTGVQQTVRAEIMTLMPQIANAAKSAVADAKLRGGSYAAALR
jgi:phage-related minor tail protein